QRELAEVTTAIRSTQQALEQTVPAIRNAVEQLLTSLHERIEKVSTALSSQLTSQQQAIVDSQQEAKQELAQSIQQHTQPIRELLASIREEILRRINADLGDTVRNSYEHLRTMEDIQVTQYRDIRRRFDQIENEINARNNMLVAIAENTANRVNETHQLLTRYHNAVGTLLHETAEHIAGLENQLETYTKKVGELESTLHMLLEKNYASTRWSIALAAIAVGLLVYALIG
ncbi:MAG: hypothetical protein NZ481_06435, partial [Candidatus Kapabacteria bacterium]|nr:hypothetical protein [Candidatus Kapabacteria bacterium]